MSAWRAGLTVTGSTIFLFWGLGICAGQDDFELPPNWKSLPAAELAELLKPPIEAGRRNKSFDLELRRHTAELLAAANLQQVTLEELVMLDTLHWMARGQHTDHDRQLIRDALEARQDDWTDVPYVQLRAKFTMLERTQVPLPELLDLGREWVDAGGDLSEVWDRDLPYLRLVLGDPETITGSFAVQWTGQVTAPETGGYTFSISPINVNGSHGDYHLVMTMTVSIGGQVILSATPDDWTSESPPISLTAGQATPLQVSLDVQTVDQLPTGAIHAMLLWEGPGVNKSVVPEARLTQPGSSESGLQAVYSWQKDGEAMSITRTDAKIDKAWPTGGVTVLRDDRFVDEGAIQLWQTTMQAAYLTDLETTEQLHPLLQDPNSSAESLDSAQRQEFLNELIVRPALLHPVDTLRIGHLYRAYRLGAAEKALDVFGLWAMQNADTAAEIPDEIHLYGVDQEARNTYYSLAMNMSQELPPQADRLRDEFLEMSDGSCCLPVAYTLAYSYLGRGEFSDWMALLDAKLEGDTVAGDLRVNWLLARAHAQEIRQASALPYRLPNARVMDGRVWIDEAATVAESPTVKLRVAKELAARLASARMIDDARATLDGVSQLASGDQQQTLADWQAAIDAYEAALVQAQSDSAAAASESYIASLQRRRDRAVAAGNTDAVARYDALIEQAQSE